MPFISLKNISKLPLEMLATTCLTFAYWLIENNHSVIFVGGQWIFFQFCGRPITKNVCEEHDYRWRT